MDTFEQEMINVKSRKNGRIIRTVNFAIKDCPEMLYNEFISDITLYNDCYWSKLQDVLRKSQAYDYLMQGQVIEQEPKIEKEEKEIMTFGGGVR